MLCIFKYFCNMEAKKKLRQLSQYIVIRLQAEQLGLIPGSAGIFSSLQCPDQLWDLRVLLFVKCCVSFIKIIVNRA